MTRVRSFVGSGVVLAAVVLAGLSASVQVPEVAAQAGSHLAVDLDALVRDPALRGASIGLVVRDAATGELLYNSQSELRRQPASNMKLITSATAMDVLGPGYRFTTSVLAGARPRGPVLDGDLYLRGTGDPTMLAQDYDDLAAKVAASGIKVVRGKLVADDTWFDATRLGLGWAWDDEPYYYNAEISALTVSPNTDYDPGTVIVKIAPTAAGQPATVTTDPPTNYITVESSATTGTTTSLSVERQHGTNTVRVSGTIAAGAQPSLQWTTVKEPTGLAASLFRDALARHGIRVIGPTQTGATSAGATTVADHQSMPLSQLLVPFMKLSNNMHAEILVKAAGRAKSGAGTWSAGTAALGQSLKTLGVDPATIYYGDGSGLSRFDQVSPDQLITLLRAVQDRSWFKTWYDALPIAGNADKFIGGTLRNRMRGTPAEGNVHAKTGTLTGVSGLSGYVTAADGRPLVFSMVSNNYIGSAKAIEDAVAIRLARYRADETSRVATLSPAPLTATQDTVECSWAKAC